MTLKEFLSKYISDSEDIQVYILMKNAIPTPVTPVTSILENRDLYTEPLNVYESYELAGLSVERNYEKRDPYYDYCKPYLAIYLKEN